MVIVIRVVKNVIVGLLIFVLVVKYVVSSLIVLIIVLVVKNIVSSLVVLVIVLTSIVEQVPTVIVA